VKGTAAPHIAVAGNAVVDIAVRGAASTRGEGSDGWGEATQLVDAPIEPLLGGCGAAAAYALGRLGARTTLVSNVGAGPFGQLIGSWLGEAGVQVAGPLAAAPAAAHVVQVDDQGRRRSAYHTGPPVPWRRALEISGAAWLLAAGYGGVRREDAAELAEVFVALRRHGVAIAFDPGPWFARCLERDAMLGLWNAVDLLCGTTAELARWLPVQASATGDLDAEAVARAVRSCGVGTAVVKDGARGAAYAGPDEVSGLAPAEPVRGRSSVGAGDTFDARLLWGLASDESLPRAVAAAVSLATGAVRHGRGVLGAFAGGE